MATEQKKRELGYLSRLETDSDPNFVRIIQLSRSLQLSLAGAIAGVSEILTFYPFR